MEVAQDIVDDPPWIYLDEMTRPTNPTVCRCLFDTGQEVTAEWVYRAYAKKLVLVSIELREHYPEIQQEWAALEGHGLKMVAWKPLGVDAYPLVRIRPLFYGGRRVR